MVDYIVAQGEIPDFCCPHCKETILTNPELKRLLDRNVGQASSLHRETWERMGVLICSMGFICPHCFGDIWLLHALEIKSKQDEYMAVQEHILIRKSIEDVMNTLRKMNAKIMRVEIETEG